MGLNFSNPKEMLLFIKKLTKSFNNLRNKFFISFKIQCVKKIQDPERIKAKEY